MNVEMMTHVEGPIVDAFYDMALLSWAEAMNPPLSLLHGPVAEESMSLIVDAMPNPQRGCAGTSASANSQLRSIPDTSVQPVPQYEPTKPQAEVSVGHRAGLF